MKMKCSIIFCFLLACAAVCAQSGFLGTEYDQHNQDETIFGGCLICKKIVTKVRKTLNDNDTVAVIEEKLHSVCEKFPFFMKRTCKKLVSKFSSKLAEELSSEDGPEKACIKLHLCKPDALWD
ncbi:hypothetical protein GJAV_G00000330 [Gymnothorax javanicus]|nr:hypothetical protein GJAV_G00000330 [Gymnothorax javanicus]